MREKEEMKGRLVFVGGCLLGSFLIASGFFLIQERPEMTWVWQRSLASVGSVLAIIAGFLCFRYCIQGAREFYADWADKRRHATAILVALGVVVGFVAIGGDSDFPMSSARWALAVFGIGTVLTGTLLSVPPPS